MMKKKLLSLVLALCMAFGSAAALPEGAFDEFASVSASAEVEGDYEYRILDDGTAEISKYKGAGSDVTIPSTLGGKKVTSIGSESFYFCYSIQSVKIPEHINKIGYGSFCSCINLKSINIPNSVKCISGESFADCGIESISIPESVNTIESGAFAGCKKLVSVVMSDGIASINDEAFSNCTSLSNISIPKTVNHIGGLAFSNTKWLRDKQSINPLVVVNAILVDGTHCSGDLIISEDIVSIADWAFKDNTCLTGITIPNGLISIGDLSFDSCKKLSKIKIPNGVNSIGTGAFRFCSSLTDITLPDSINYIKDDAFFGCTSLNCVTIPSSIKCIGEYALGYLYYDYQNYHKKYGFNISCYKGTAGEKYAIENGFDYELLDVEHVDAKDATCMKNGNIEYWKYKNNYYSDKYATKKITKDQITIKALDHDYVETVVAPTCTKQGYTLHKCSRCGDSYKDTYTAKTAHSWSKWTTTKAATCTADGEQTRTCSVCKKTETKTLSKLGHDYVETVVKPTCKAQGYTLHKCSRCGDSYKDTYTAKTAHTWSKWTTSKAATCTADGEQTRTCSVCKKTETKTLTKLGHNYVKTVVAPTCKAQGYTLHKCSRCGDSYKDTYTAKTTHTWSKWTTSKAATCTADGEQTRTCSVCKKTETKTLTKLGHNYVKTVVKPTCTKQGYTLHKCSRCGDSYKDTYTAKTAHSWSKWTTTKAATCTSDGEQTRTCSVCKKTETKTLSKLGHNYVKTVVAPTCKAQGYTLHKCSRCGDSYKDTYTAKTAHKWSAWKTTGFDFAKKTSTQTKKCTKCGKTITQTTKNAITRIAGANRFDSAAVISRAMNKTSDTVIIATGLTFNDALVAVPLASVYNAPLLLATEKHITAQTEAELKRLGAKNVIVVSTNGAVGDGAKAELSGYETTYIEGNSCFETAAKVAEALQDKTKKAPNTIFFATDETFADALSASPVAAIKNAPILYLKNTGSIDKATADYLKSVKGKVKNAYVIGGDGVISNAMMKNVANALGLTVNKTVQRVAGKNRYETCTAVNNKFKSVLTGDGICVAKGLDFPDALAGGVYAAATKQALFLADGKKLQDCQNTYLKSKNAGKITVFGGTGAVDDELVKLIAKASV